MLSPVSFPTPCKHINKSFWCLELGLTSKITGSLFISPTKIMIKKEPNCVPLSLCYFFSDSSHPIWQLLKIRKFSRSLLLFLPWTANAPSQAIFSSLFCVQVCDPFHFMAGFLSHSSVTTPPCLPPSHPPPSPPPLRPEPSLPRPDTSSAFNGHWSFSALKHIQVCRKSDFLAQMKTHFGLGVQSVDLERHPWPSLL